MLADAPMFRHPAWPEPWPPMTKRAVADRLLDRIVSLLDARDASPQTGGRDRAMEENRA